MTKGKELWVSAELATVTTVRGGASVVLRGTGVVFFGDHPWWGGLGAARDQGGLCEVVAKGGVGTWRHGANGKVVVAGGVQQAVGAADTGSGYPVRASLLHLGAR